MEGGQGVGRGGRKQKQATKAEQMLKKDRGETGWGVSRWKVGVVVRDLSIGFAHVKKNRRYLESKQF